MLQLDTNVLLNKRSGCNKIYAHVQQTATTNELRSLYNQKHRISLCLQTNKCTQGSKKLRVKQQTQATPEDTRRIPLSP